MAGQEGEQEGAPDERRRGRGFGNVGQRNLGRGQGDARTPISQGVRDVVRREVDKAHPEIVRAVQNQVLGGLELQLEETRRPWDGEVGTPVDEDDGARALGCPGWSGAISTLARPGFP